MVGSEVAVNAMQAAGFDVEILRASCYCERDRLNRRGFLSCVVDGAEPQWMRVSRYKGAGEAMDPEEAQELRAAITRNYKHDADRLIDPGDGTVETYVVDSNWPGATSCAISHLRALVGAAAAGYEQLFIFEDDAIIPAKVARGRGWCDSCDGEVCFCPDSWAMCIEEATELMRRAPGLDLLYLGIGEAFENPGRIDGLLGSDAAGSDDDGVELGGVTEIGYTWCAHAIGYSRSALDDVLALKLWQLLWAQDETIPHLYSHKPWNKRFVHALREAGWRRRWVAGAPSDCFNAFFKNWDCMGNDGWVDQLEGSEDAALFGTAARSSNSHEF